MDLDAACFAENAYLIKRYDPAFVDASLAAICFDWVIESSAQIVPVRQSLPGYRVRREVPILRAFMAELEPIQAE